MISRKYETWEEFFTEVELMCNNAFTYNEDNSDVYKDAKQIKVGQPRGAWSDDRICSTTIVKKSAVVSIRPTIK